jgi:HlyD family secretion protein
MAKPLRRGACSHRTITILAGLSQLDTTWLSVVVNRRRVVINGVLALAVAGVLAASYVTVTASSSSQQPTGQTVKVTRGTLTATVTASGNAEAATTVEVNFSGSGGQVTKIYVKTGQQVTKGQRLLKIDDSSAKESLRTAKATLASAKAQLKTTTQGQSAEDKAEDAASVAAAKTSVANAETALQAAKDTYALDKKQQNQLVKSATAAQLTQAKQTRASTLLKDRQAIKTQRGQLHTAEDQLASQRATAAKNAQPARQGDVDSAQAQIDSARVTVATARRTLAETVLRAPVSGTVAAISAVKGQSSGSGGSGGTSGSGSTGSGSANSSTTGSTGSTSSSSSSSSGLVTLTDLSRKHVVASVAEADITKIKVKQTAQVSFPASNVTVPGTVTAIDTQSTVTNNVVEYGVTVVLGGNATSIRLGQSASITITVGRKSDVLSVPTSAITTAGDRSTVTRREGETDRTVEVQTGMVGSTGTEITSGLAEGDTVVLPTSGSSGSNLTFPRIGVGGPR